MSGSAGVSVPVGSWVVVVPQTGPGASRKFLRITNIGASGSGTAWLVHGVSPSAMSSIDFLANNGPNKPSSIPLAPYGNPNNMPSTEEFSSTFIPQGPVVAISDGGTSGTSPANLTILVSQ